MKKVCAIALLFVVLSLVACGRDEVTAPPRSAAEKSAVLAKSSVCSVVYEPANFLLNDIGAAVWPPSNPNLTLWYIGGAYPESPDYPNVHDCIVGFGVIDGSTDCWAGKPFKISITLRKRGIDCDSVSPGISVYSDLDELLVLFPTTNDFVTLESDVFPAGPTQLKFIFNPCDIDLSGNHVDVNIDVANVVITAEE